MHRHVSVSLSEPGSSICGVLAGTGDKVDKLAAERKRDTCHFKLYGNSLCGAFAGVTMRDTL